MLIIIRHSAISNQARSFSLLLLLLPANRYTRPIYCTTTSDVRLSKIVHVNVPGNQKNGHCNFYKKFLNINYESTQFMDSQQSIYQKQIPKAPQLLSYLLFFLFKSRMSISRSLQIRNGHGLMIIKNRTSKPTSSSSSTESPICVSLHDYSRAEVQMDGWLAMTWCKGGVREASSPSIYHSIPYRNWYLHSPEIKLLFSRI